MKIIKEINDFYALMENSWSGAIDTLKEVKEAGKQEELMALLEETFYGGTPTETEVNDFLWFDRDYIYEALGEEDEEEDEWLPSSTLDEDEDEEEDEEEEEEEEEDEDEDEDEEEDEDEDEEEEEEE